MRTRSIVETTDIDLKQSTQSLAFPRMTAGVAQGDTIRFLDAPGASRALCVRATRRRLLVEPSFATLANESGTLFWLECADGTAENRPHAEGPQMTTGSDGVGARHEPHPSVEPIERRFGAKFKR